MGIYIGVGVVVAICLALLVVGFMLRRQRLNGGSFRSFCPPEQAGFKPVFLSRYQSVGNPDTTTEFPDRP